MRLSLLSACLAWLLALAALSTEAATRLSTVEVVTTDRLGELMSGEWMLEFYAPWCPACKQFADTWENFADWAKDGDAVPIRVGKVDVTQETMLSGQFMVTHLPSIYHIVDGAVRVYHGSRTYSDLVSYIEEKKWKTDDPVPWWRSPTATHMRAIGIIFWLSEKAKDLQVTLEEQYELPTYAVFILIAIATIVVGLTLGGLTVCCIELCMRMCSRKKTEQPREPRPAKAETLEPEPSTQTREETQTTTSAAGDGKQSSTEKPTTSEGGTRQRKRKGKKNADGAKDH